MPHNLETTTFAPTSGARVWLVVLCSTRSRQPEHTAATATMHKVFLINFTGCNLRPNAAAHRPRASDVRLARETSPRGSVQPACSASVSFRLCGVEALQTSLILFLRVVVKQQTLQTLVILTTHNLRKQAPTGLRIEQMLTERERSGRQYIFVSVLHAPLCITPKPPEKVQSRRLLLAKLRELRVQLNPKHHGIVNVA